MAQAQTMEIIIFAAIGLRVISLIERPLRGWRLGLVLAISRRLRLRLLVVGHRQLLRRGMAHRAGW